MLSHGFLDEIRSPWTHAVMTVLNRNCDSCSCHGVVVDNVHATVQ